MKVGDRLWCGGKEWEVRGFVDDQAVVRIWNEKLDRWTYEVNSKALMMLMTKKETD